jgi:hypothetical protein
VPRKGIIVASRQRAICSGRDGGSIEGVTAGDPALDQAAILSKAAWLPESEAPPRSAQGDSKWRN